MKYNYSYYTQPAMEKVDFQYGYETDDFNKVYYEWFCNPFTRIDVLISDYDYVEIDKVLELFDEGDFLYGIDYHSLTMSKEDFEEFLNKNKLTVDDLNNGMIPTPRFKVMYDVYFAIARVYTDVKYYIRNKVWRLKRKLFKNNNKEEGLPF